ncbi:MAG: redoxin domain-containing protein [Bryobacteraceae bacterium]
MSELLERTRTRSRQSLVELCATSAVLLVFLHYSGCPFCREDLADPSQALPALNAGGIRSVLVHMGSEERLEALLQRYRLGGVEYITDRSRKLYRAFGLLKSSPFALFSIQRVWGAGGPSGAPQPWES